MQTTNPGRTCNQSILFPLHFPRNGTYCIAKSNKCVLGDTYIQESNECKYLEVYLSRSLKITQNIGHHIKDYLNNNLNGMIRILGKHGNFHRMEVVVHYGIQYYVIQQHMADQYGFICQPSKRCIRESSILSS